MKKNYSSILSAILLITGMLSAYTGFAVTHTVQVSDFQFSPATFNAQVGDTVRWTWVNGFHTTTSITVPPGAQTWDSPITTTNRTFSYKITQAGVYSYRCTPHAPAMNGSFTATGSGIDEYQNIASWYAYPQPFKGELNIHTGSYLGKIAVQVYDLTGRKVIDLEKESVAGERHISVNTQDLKPGIYFCTLAADSKKRSIRVVKD